ncbi:hypothetical protein B0H11DRAFT_2037154, partial [Mycena galericulata]
MAPTLPTEILEVIVDACSDDPETLALCGAAGRQFLVRSRMHLFSKLSQSTTLVHIAQRLSNLRTFTLREGKGSEWSPALIQTMHLCAHAPSIQSVELSGLRATDLNSLFAIFSSPHRGRKLEQLRFSNLLVGPDLSFDSELFARKNRQPFVASMFDVDSSFHNDSLRPIFDLLSRSLPLIKLSRLRILRLTVGDDLWLVNQFIQLGASCLMQLDLRLTHSWASWDGFQVSFRDNQPLLLEQLSTLRFEISVDGVMPAVLRILQMLGAPLLTEIIFLSIEDGHYFHAAEEEDPDPRWSAL